MRLHVSDSWFDSSLHLGGIHRGWNAVLQIRIRVYLEQYEPPGGAETRDGVRLVGWGSPPAPVSPRLGWSAYRQLFKQEVEGFWSNRLWLVPSYHWGEEATGRRSPGSTIETTPNVSCRLSIVWASREDAHMHAQVVRLHPEEDFQRSSCRMPNAGGRIADLFVSTDSHLDDLDVLEKEWGDRQIPVVHEMGHYLGLDHVAGGSNDDEAYGTGYQRGDVMGAGMRLEPWHAHPWKKRLIWDHLGHRFGPSNWQAVITRRPSPRDFAGANVRPTRGREHSQSGGVRDLDGGV